MSILKVLKLARFYGKANRIIKKGKAKLDDIKECRDNLMELIVELEENKTYFTNEIKKVKTLIGKLNQKATEV